MFSSEKEKEEFVSDEEEEEEFVFVEETEGPVCRLSLPADPHTLSRRARNCNHPTDCFACPSKVGRPPGHELYYHCTTCDVQFHYNCHEWPRKMTHPYHPQHPLISSSDSSIPDNCTWCGENVKNSSFVYRCSICNFCLDSSCSQKFPLPTITNPKSHHHSLIFLPRPLLHPCDACGLVEKSDPSYVCFQCNYVVHKSCIDLPRVIKLTRHPHRLFYTPFLSPKISSLCRLCYKTVDNKCGQYSCNHDDCSYVAHSKCATHTEVWDGRELEWEPEEFGQTEDYEPFKRVDDDLIKYFCHEHHLKLEKYDDVRDADKQCQACILHIDSRDFYNCTQCDFFLHEVCANLPRKLDHALHHHPLFLDPTPPKTFDPRGCWVCSRSFSGFSYKCPCEHSCENFQVDVRCILVPECFTHKSHEHPLFIPIATKRSNRCQVCKAEYATRYLQCTLCEFTMCYNCATIPDKLHYKYDALPLSLYYGEVSDEIYWCEVCETKLDSTEWFYTCNKPNITIHCMCVFGDSAYMKPGHTFHHRYFLSVKVVCNNSTRPFCNECEARCSSSVYFKLSDETVVCSIYCLYWRRL